MLLLTITADPTGKTWTFTFDLLSKPIQVQTRTDVNVLGKKHYGGAIMVMPV